MNLKIEISGQLERVIVTKLPRRFIQKIFKHCLGKNNTPYFANNCFKGVLYFDYEFAIKFAESVGFTWSTWREVDAIHKTQGYLFEQYADITASVNGETPLPLSFSTLETRPRALELDSALQQLSEEEVCILLGSVDKGSETWEGEIDEEFDQGRLLFSLDSLEYFKLPDQIVTAVSYDQKPLTHVPGNHTGKNMMMPVLFDKQGRELDINDFMGMDLEL